jgi:hypothetical protein
MQQMDDIDTGQRVDGGAVGAGESRFSRRRLLTYATASLTALATLALAWTAYSGYSSEQRFQEQAQDISKRITVEQNRIASEAQAAAAEEQRAREAEAALRAKVTTTCAQITYFNRGSLDGVISSIGADVMSAMKSACPSEYTIAANYFKISAAVYDGLSAGQCTQSNFGSILTSTGTFQNKSEFALDIELNFSFSSGGTVLDTGTALLQSMAPGEERAYTAYGNANGYRMTSCAFASLTWWPSN